MTSVVADRSPRAAPPTDTMCNRSRPDVRIRRPSAISGPLGGRPGASPGMSCRRETVDGDDGAGSSREVEGALGAQLRWATGAEPSIRRSTSRPETSGDGLCRPCRNSGSRRMSCRSVPRLAGIRRPDAEPALRIVQGCKLVLDRARPTTIRLGSPGTLRVPASAGVPSREQGTRSRRPWQPFPATWPENYSTSSCN
jgi:hypothetical protein